MFAFTFYISVLKIIFINLLVVFLVLFNFTFTHIIFTFTLTFTVCSVQFTSSKNSLNICKVKVDLVVLFFYRWGCWNSFYLGWNSVRERETYCWWVFYKNLLNDTGFRHSSTSCGCTDCYNKSEMLEMLIRRTIKANIWFLWGGARIKFCVLNFFQYYFWLDFIFFLAKPGFTQLFILDFVNH